MNAAKDLENFPKLKCEICDLIKFDCEKYSDSFLSRRINVRLRALQIDSYEGYISLLKENVIERELLHKELTINVTNFFRDKEMWIAFKDVVIPALVNQKRMDRDRTIKVWSAGSSSGEEALSIAICLNEALRIGLGGFDVKINGTDINNDIINTAEMSVYEEQQFWEMNKLNPLYMNKYFEKIDNKLYQSKPIIRSLVSFRTGDILSGPPIGKFDIIFCRNTVIYFSREAKSKLYEDFFNTLNPGGFFIMGKTEVLQGPTKELFDVFDPKERIYRKGR